jgi:MoxR-like ATPase
VLLWGAPGVGKTAALTALAKEHRAELVTLIGATLDPAEVCGVLYPVDGMLRRAPADWTARLITARLAGREAWLLLDELSCAPPATQAALLRVVQERAAGPVDLRGVRIVAAANPADSAADGGWLSPAMAGRWLHLDWTVDPSAWCAGEIAGWGQPRAPELAAASALVSAWIGRSPASLAPPAPASTVDVRGHPSPRSWSAVARMIAAIGGSAQSAVATRAGIAAVDGLVGHGAGNELRTWAAALDLPDPAAVLAGAALPKRGDQVTACLSAVVALALADSAIRDAQIAAAWRVLARARPDHAVLAGRALADAAEDVPDEAHDLATRIAAARRSVAA